MITCPQVQFLQLYINPSNMNQSCDLKPTSNRYINSNLKRGGGGGVQAYHFGKKYSELGLVGKART